MAVNPKKHDMPTQDAQVRARNFQEVALGYPLEIAQEEAKRCLNCKNRPCVSGCPEFFPAGCVRAGMPAGNPV